MVIWDISKKSIGLSDNAQGLSHDLFKNSDKDYSSSTAAGWDWYFPTLNPEAQRLVQTGQSSFISVVAFDPKGLPVTVAESQKNPTPTQAQLLAKNFDKQVHELKALEAELKRNSADPKEIQDEMLSLVEGLGFGFLQFAAQTESNDADSAKTQEKLKHLAANTYQMLARVAAGSAVEEIKIKAERIGNLSI